MFLGLRARWKSTFFVARKCAFRRVKAPEHALNGNMLFRPYINQRSFICNPISFINAHNFAYKLSFKNFKLFVFWFPYPSALDILQRRLLNRPTNGPRAKRASIWKLAVLMKLLEIFFIVLLTMKRNFCTNFRVFISKLSCPNMEFSYFAVKSTLVSADYKIGTRDLVEKNPRSILHRGTPIL